MGWHDDDFPDENTDPSMLPPAQGNRRPVQQPQQPGYPQQGPQPQQPAYAPQNPAYPQQQPGPRTGGYPQQPGPNTGGYPQQPGPNTGGYPQQPGPNTGGYPQQPGPQTGGYPQQGPTTGGHPQVGPSGPPSQPVPVLKAPVVAIEEEAKASRVVYGLSGTAVGGIAGVLLGVLNTYAQGLTITEGTEFIFQSAIWFAFLVGALCFWKPERFAYAVARFTEDKDDEAE